MKTAESFALTLKRDCGVREGDHVLAAVSGGADSVALLCLLGEVRESLSLTISCAHMEHGIRGAASRADMAFVQALCSRMGIPFYAKQADVPAYALAHGLGLEDAARTLRYAFLTRTARETGAEHIALAHHALDQAETVLMHAARGSDLRGLRAMQYRREDIIRPLLDWQPQALRAYLEARGQSWREDESNGDMAYTRNRIRAEVLPSLTAAYPGAVAALCRLARAAQRDEKYFAAALEQVNLTRRTLVDGAALERSELAGMDAALISRVLARETERLGFGAQDADAIEQITNAVLDGKEATVNLTGGAHAYAGRRYVSLIHAGRTVPETELSLGAETKTPYGVFLVREADTGETGDGVTCQAIDARWLDGALVTGRREGDSIVPFGRHRAVKLKKLMIDAGVERSVRNSFPVIRQGETIIWAVGLRPSELCRAQGGRRLMVIYKGNE